MHPSLHPNCHFQVIYAKFNLKVHYPPPYEHEVWHYKEVDTDLIRQSVEMFDWDRAFKNSKVNDMADTLAQKQSKAYFLILFLIRQ